MSVPKLERLLDLIAALLHTERPLTAEQLRERIPGYPEDRDSFKRAFERDKKDLRDMGVPLRIDPVPGANPPEDGYRIDPDEYYLPDPGLDVDELAAINLAASAVRLEGVSAVGGLRKLGAAPGVQDTPSTIATLPAAPNLSVAFDAVAARRQLRFRYGGKDRVVDPSRLQHRRGRWYLQGHDHGAGEGRSFRLDRVEGALEVGDAVPAEWGDDGSVVLTLPVRHPDGFRSFVLGFLDDAEVLSPPQLRDDLVAWLREVVDGGDR